MATSPAAAVSASGLTSSAAPIQPRDVIGTALGVDPELGRATPASFERCASAGRNATAHRQ